MFPLGTQELGALAFAATKDVFATMLAMELQSEGVSENHHPPLSSEISALLGVAGVLQGTVFVHCTHTQGQLFTARLLGSAQGELHEEDVVLDAVGELVNMVAGNLKRVLSDGQLFDLSVPTVAVPQGGRLYLKAKRSVLVQLGASCGSFHTEVTLGHPPGLL
jgi:CheY-specific phosphatase CheX